jgi:hypothetical protein
MKFSDAEIAKLQDLQNRYHTAIIQRSSNPDNFYANVTFLKRLASLKKDFRKFVMPNFTKAKKAEKNINNTPGDFFSRIRAYLLTKKANEFADAAYTFIHSETLQADLDKMLAKEPRIVDFAVDGHTRHVNVTNKFLSSQDEKTIPDYTIIYSDNSALIFHSFDDEKELQECKIAFDEKMRLLAPKLGSSTP